MAFVVESLFKDGQLLYKMARTKQTARKQPTPGLSTRQVEVSTSDEGTEESVARKKPKLKAKKRKADISGEAPEAAGSPPKKKSKQSKKKKEVAMPGTSKQKKEPAAKKEKGAKKKDSVPDAKSKAKKERYVRPRYRGDKEPPASIPTEQERKRKVLVEYSTDEEVSEALLDESILKGDYTGIDTQKIKRVKREVRITLPYSPTMPTYPESFIAWYKDHGMTGGMKAALRGIGWTDQDIASCKIRFIKRYGVTAGYKVRYPDEALLEDDQPGAGGFADLIATSPPPVVQQGTSSQAREADRYERLISTAKAAMAQREAQSKAEKEAKRKGGPMMEPPLKRTHMPTATLSKAPSDSEMGTVPTTQVSTQGETGVVMALGASSLEDYLTSRDTQTPEATTTVGQVPNPSSGTNPADAKYGRIFGRS